VGTAGVDGPEQEVGVDEHSGVIEEIEHRANVGDVDLDPQIRGSVPVIGRGRPPGQSGADEPVDRLADPGSDKGDSPGAECTSSNDAAGTWSLDATGTFGPAPGITR